MTTTDLALPPELALDEAPFEIEEVDQLADVDGIAGEAEMDDDHPVHYWRIEDDGGAEWAMRHLLATRSDIGVIEDQAREWVRQIDAWAASRIKPLLHRERFFQSHLEDYGLRCRDASGGTIKTVALPTGAVKTTAVAPKVIVADQDAWEEWAAAHPDDERVKVQYRPVAAAMKATCIIEERLDDDDMAFYVVLDGKDGEELPWAGVDPGGTSVKVVVA